MNSPLYINRIVLSPKMGKCDVTLRKGLNVILSDDVSDLNVEVETRNSTGKTTFIHLIDYALGKEKFIYNLNETNKLLFKEEYVICEISIYNKKYTVYRSILDNDIIVIYESWVSNSIIEGDIKNIKFKIFDLSGYISFIENEIFKGKNYFKNKRIISYRSIMSFIIRDQFFGFSKYSSGIKDETAKVCRDRIEFLFGLTTTEKLLIKEKIDTKSKEKKDLITQCNVIKSYLSQIINDTPVRIKKEIQKNKKDIIDLQKQLKEYDNKTSSIEIEKDAKREEKEKLQNKLMQIKNDIVAIDSRISNYVKALNDNKNELQKVQYIEDCIEILEGINQIKCPLLTKLIGEKVQCPIIKNEESKDKNKQIIDARKKLIEYEIKDLEKAVNTLENQFEQSTNDFNLTKESINKINFDIGKEMNSIIENRDIILNKISELEYDNEKLENNLLQYEYLDNLKKQKNNKTKEINDEKNNLDKLESSGLGRIAEIYNDIVFFISNKSRDGIIYKKTLEPVILFKNGDIDTGAGIKSISIIAFDLAMLTYALEKESANEYSTYLNLLIHDSPKRNDIDINMYKRVFDYVINLEEKYSNIDFQYIITTLDISQKVKDNEKEYIKLRLDNSGDGGKLFEATINI